MKKHVLLFWRKKMRSKPREYLAVPFRSARSLSKVHFPHGPRFQINGAYDEASYSAKSLVCRKALTRSTPLKWMTRSSTSPTTDIIPTPFGAQIALAAWKDHSRSVHGAAPWIMAFHAQNPTVSPLVSFSLIFFSFLFNLDVCMSFFLQKTKPKSLHE